jgi:hypothetical protein
MSDRSEPHRLEHHDHDAGSRQDGLASAFQGGACCALRRRIVPLLAVATIVSSCAAAYFAGRSSALPAGPRLGDLPWIDATAAVTSERYSMATGTVSDDADGLFVLDHNSGLLQCSVIYPRMAKFMAQFTINVADAVGTGAKGGQYMMVTGRAEFQASSTRPAASTVVYVIDTASGNYACYGIPFNRITMNSNHPQQGALVLLATGTANPVIDRDDLR